MKKYFPITLLLLFSLSLFSQISRTNAFERNAKMRKGISWNGLQWGMYNDLTAERDMEIISNKGFQNVRIPIEWTVFVDDDYNIQSDFFNYVDNAVESAINSGLFPYINIIGWSELVEFPNEHHDDFIHVWGQIATHYQNFSDSLMFEILNEPAPNFSMELYNQFQNDALNKIRESNPNRIVIITIANWSDYSSLPEAEIPNDENLILTLHNYSTHEITHQGAEFLGNYAEAFLGTVWSGSTVEYTQMQSCAKSINNYSTKLNIPILISEFGVYGRAGNDTKFRWINAMTENFEQNNISWTLWDYSTSNYNPMDHSFSVFESEHAKWEEPLTSSIINGFSVEQKENTSTILQHDFNSSIEPFELTFWNQVQDKVSIEHLNGEAKITVLDTLEHKWDAHLTIPFDYLQVGHYYSFSMDISSDTFRTVGMSCTYIESSNLTYTEKNKFCMILRVNEQIDEDPYFRLFLGRFPGTLYVDNFKLEEININLAQTISIEQNNLTIDGLFEEQQITAIILPENADEKSIRWEMNENDIAFIDKFGIIRPKGNNDGSFMVFAHSKDGSNLVDSTQITLVNQQRGYLKNGNFSLGFSYWNRSWGGGLFPTITNDSTLKIVTYKIIEYNNQISISQKNLKIEKNKTYKLKFKAKSENNRNIDVNIGMNEDPWISYFNKNINLNTQWQDFSFIFTNNFETNEEAVLQFNFGEDNTNWFLDDVILEESNESKINVSFIVDTKNENVENEVGITGNWLNWANPIKLNKNGSIYSKDIEFLQNNYFEYKFVMLDENSNISGWELINDGNCTANGNRFLNSQSSNIVLDTVCYSSCDACPSSSINILKDNNITLWPNPVNNFLKLNNLDFLKNASLKIYSVNGNLQKSLFLKNQATESINVSEFKSGVYYLVIKNDKQIINLKFIKI